MTQTALSPRHPIRVVALRTGLTAATIRAWERRYHAVEPARSDGGQRLYSDRDIERLNVLRELTDMGRSIGSVAALPPEEAQALLSEDREAAPSDPSTEPQGHAWVDDAFRCMIQMDSEALERTLWRAFRSLGARTFLEGVAAPLLERVGSSWAVGRVTPAQEHMASGVLERVLAWMNDPALSPGDGPRLVVATLPGERHALGARLAAAAAAIDGWRTTYLGPDLPVTEIAAAARNVGADAVAISAVRTDRARETERDLVELRALLDPEVRVVVGGAGAAHLLERLPPGVEACRDLSGFTDLRRTLLPG
jgi:DNA-binding transcriptional MerR regulator/methylmalonyl-CoA mutase cobalamin-binding subunit